MSVLRGHFLSDGRSTIEFAFYLHHHMHYTFSKSTTWDVEFSDTLHSFPRDKVRQLGEREDCWQHTQNWSPMFREFIEKTKLTALNPENYTFPTCVEDSRVAINPNVNFRVKFSSPNNSSPRRPVREWWKLLGHLNHRKLRRNQLEFFGVKGRERTHWPGSRWIF